MKKERFGRGGSVLKATQGSRRQRAVCSFFSTAPLFPLLAIAAVPEGLNLSVLEARWPGSPHIAHKVRRASCQLSAASGARAFRNGFEVAASRSAMQPLSLPQA